MAPCESCQPSKRSDDHAGPCRLPVAPCHSASTLTMQWRTTAMLLCTTYATACLKFHGWDRQSFRLAGLKYQHDRDAKSAYTQVHNFDHFLC